MTLAEELQGLCPHACGQDSCGCIICRSAEVLRQAPAPVEVVAKSVSWLLSRDGHTDHRDRDAARLIERLAGELKDATRELERVAPRLAELTLQLAARDAELKVAIEALQFYEDGDDLDWAGDCGNKAIDALAKLTKKAAT